MKKLLLLVVMFIFLTSCSPFKKAIEFAVNATIEAMPTQTAYPTFTLIPTSTPMLPIIVTATVPSITLTPSSTITPEPTQTQRPTENPNLTTDKLEGVWLVGQEVAPGNWRAVGGDCYEVIFDKFNEQMNMESGVGSVIYVPESAFTVKFVSYPGYCTWTYLGN